jgi:DNA mismatch endonuclease, patch repair protein
MARIKTSDTAPEIALRRALFRLGLRGWRCHRRDLPGTPDLAFGKARLAVFVDGAFWHGHASRYKAGQSGKFWDEKIRRNVERDREADIALERRGWSVLRIWDFDIKADAGQAARRVADAVDQLSERGRSTHER